MKIAVIQFPGSNCEAESLRAVREVGMEAEEFLWNRDYRDLAVFDGYFIVGGFSYEDRSRSGIIAALDPLLPHLAAQAAAGKPLLGICNGAQVLVETGLVPGLKNNQLGAALATNKRLQHNTVLGTGYYNAWVHMQLSTAPQASAFTRHYSPGTPLAVPIAHGEGRFIIPPELLAEMQTKNLIAFRYCDATGEIRDEFPINPNGAAFNAAAIINPAGNIMAMMPHPERSLAGAPLFASMRDYIADKKTITAPEPLHFSPPPLTIPTYQKPENAVTLPIQLVITDNEAVTVENTLQHLGIPVTIERATHWELGFTTDNAEQQAAALQTIAASGELYNANKERPIALKSNPESRYLLVRYRDDFEGQAKSQAITSRLGLTAVTVVKRGTLWKVTSEHGSIDLYMERLIATHILFNPYSQECFVYG